MGKLNPRVNHVVRRHKPTRNPITRVLLPGANPNNTAYLTTNSAVGDARRGNHPAGDRAEHPKPPAKEQ